MHALLIVSLLLQAGSRASSGSSMTIAKRPLGHSEILDPTDEQIGDLQARKDSGELSRLVFDKTARGRVRAAWYRKAALKRHHHVDPVTGLASGIWPCHAARDNGQPEEIQPQKVPLRCRVQTYSDSTAMAGNKHIFDSGWISGDEPLSRQSTAVTANRILVEPDTTVSTERHEIEQEVEHQEEIDQPSGPSADTIVRLAVVAFAVTIVICGWMA